MKKKLSGVLLIMALSASVSAAKFKNLQIVLEFTDLAMALNKSLPNKSDSYHYYDWPRIFFEKIEDFQYQPLFKIDTYSISDDEEITSDDEEIKYFNNLFSTEQKQKIEEYTTKKNKAIYLPDYWQKVCYVLNREREKLNITEQLKQEFIDSLMNSKEKAIEPYSFLFRVFRPFATEKLAELLKTKTDSLNESKKTIELEKQNIEFKKRDIKEKKKKLEAEISQNCTHQQLMKMLQETIDSQTQSNENAHSLYSAKKIKKKIKKKINIDKKIQTDDDQEFFSQNSEKPPSIPQVLYVDSQQNNTNAKNEEEQKELSGVPLIMALNTSVSAVKFTDLAMALNKGLPNKSDSYPYHAWPHIFFEKIEDFENQPLFKIDTYSISNDEAITYFKNLFSKEQKQKIEKYITQSNKLIFLSDDWKKVCYVLNNERAKLNITEQLKQEFIDSLMNSKEKAIEPYSFLFHVFRPFATEKLTYLSKNKMYSLNDSKQDIELEKRNIELQKLNIKYANEKLKKEISQNCTHQQLMKMLQETIDSQKKSNENAHSLYSAKKININKKIQTDDDQECFSQNSEKPPSIAQVLYVDSQTNNNNATNEEEQKGLKALEFEGKQSLFTQQQQFMQKNTQNKATNPNLLYNQGSKKTNSLEEAENEENECFEYHISNQNQYNN